MDRVVGISIGGLQRRYGDIRAIEIAKEIGADAVDFALLNLCQKGRDIVG